jgi:hypothetical protein
MMKYKTTNIKIKGRKLIKPPDSEPPAAAWAKALLIHIKTSIKDKIKTDSVWAFQLKP